MNTKWPKVRLGDVLTPAAREEAVDAMREYRLLGVRLDGQGPFLRETVTGAQISATKLFRVAKDDFIYSRLFAWRGAFGIIEPQFDGCHVSAEFPTFQPRDGAIDARFLRYWFRLRSTLDKVEEDCTGSTPLTRNRFKENFFLELEIPLPPPEEQRWIVARIEGLAGKIEEARGLRRQAAEEAEALTNSQVGAIFKVLTERCGTTRLETLIVEACYGTSQKCSLEREEAAVPVLRIPNVAAEGIELDGLKFAQLSARETEHLALHEGDILVVRTNGSLDLVGRSAVVDALPEPMAFASYMIRLRLNQATILPEYAQRMLRHLRISGQLIDFARTTAGQYNVSLGRLRSAEIPVPPISEQHRIVAQLDDLQEKANALNNLQSGTSAELDALMPSILDKAFRGEL